jgi:hypothetical protein
MFNPGPSSTLWGEVSIRGSGQACRLNGQSSWVARIQAGLSGHHLCATFSRGSKIATVIEPFGFRNEAILDNSYSI